MGRGSSTIGLLWTLASKDLRILFRDKAGLFWMLGFPLVFGLFFGAIFSVGAGSGGSAKMRVAVVDEDRGPEARAFVKRLAESAAVLLEDMSEAEAVEAVRKGRKTAYLRIPKGWGKEGASFFGGGEGPGLRLGMDPSRRAEEGYLQGLIMEAWFGGMRELFGDPVRMRAQLRRSLDRIEEASDLTIPQKMLFRTFFASLEKFVDDMEGSGLEGKGGFEGPRLEIDRIARTRNGPVSAFAVTFPQSILWGILGCVTGFAITLVRERVHGTWLRLRASPVPISVLLAGKGLACFLATSIVAFFLLFVAGVFLGTDLGHLPRLVAAVFACGVCFSGIMMLLSTCGRTENAVAGIGWAVMMPMAMAGGGMIPLIAMPSWLLRLSDFSPVKWGIYALEGAMWRGLGWTELLPAFGILVGLGVLGLSLGTYVLSRRP